MHYLHKIGYAQFFLSAVQNKTKIVHDVMD